MVLTGFSLLFIELDLILWVFMSHLWFIYVEIRNPAYKSFMMLIFVFYFIFAWVDLSEALIKNAKENYDKSVAGPSRPS